MEGEDFIKLHPYVKQELKWPQKGNVILAQYDQESVILYQAFKSQIAETIVKHQCYHH